VILIVLHCIALSWVTDVSMTTACCQSCFSHWVNFRTGHGNGFWLVTMDFTRT